MSNLPVRNRHFAGRETLLEELHRRLRDDAAASVLPMEAVHGLGGVGKTELAAEFAHRYRSDYDVVWWIPAEQAITAAAALAELARRLGVPETADQPAMVDGLFALLRRRERWLLIYDNAEQPHTLDGLLPPGGAGHVLVTSRWSAWGRQAEPLRLDVLDRSESIRFLTGRNGITEESGLGELADLLGDLPLALEQATGYLEETGSGLCDYLVLVRERAAELFAAAPDGDADQRSVATVWTVSLDRVRDQAPAAETLLTLCAFLGPEIPRALPTAHPDVLPEPLAAAVSDLLAYHRTIAVLGRYSLATVDPACVHLHRLVQLVVRARLTAAEEREWAAVAAGLVDVAFPDDSAEVERWPECQRLLPHLLAAIGHTERLHVAGDDDGWLLQRASTYLREQGQYRQALPLARRAVDVVGGALGTGHIEVAWCRQTLGSVLYSLGDYGGARVELEQALEISRSTLGPDHPQIAVTRNNLGRVLQALGRLDDARRELDAALTIITAAYGPDHLHSSRTRSNLGTVLQDLGDLDGARAQHERALKIGEAALGPDHPDIGKMRYSLGRVLQALGDLPGARAEFARALHISETAVGPDHPQTHRARTDLDQLGG